MRHYFNLIVFLISAEVVACVNESDSETKVPGKNIPGTTHTRAGRVSITNLRYLDWLAWVRHKHLIEAISMFLLTWLLRFEI